MMLWALVCLVHLPLATSLIAPPLPQAGVRLFLASENRTLPNHAMVNAAQFRVDDLAPKDGISDAIWCQAAPSLGGVHYQWYGPGGLPVLVNTTLANINAITDSTTFVVIDDEQVGLARPIGTGVGDNEGLYQCVITEDNGAQHTLVVGVYKTGTYNQNTGPVVSSTVQFFLTSPRDADPPQFTLSFNVSNAPATTVKCSVNEQSIENMSVSRAILNGEPPTLTEVTVTIRQRSAGVCNCTVSNARVEDGTLTCYNCINITAYPGYAKATLNVTGTPTDVMILVSWTAPTTPVAGYEVFYETATGERHSVGNTTDTKLTLSRLEEMCSIFVVAYGEDYIEQGSARGNIMDSGEGRVIFVLPSARSNVTGLSVNCACGFPLNISGITGANSVTSTSVIIRSSIPSVNEYSISCLTTSSTSIPPVDKCTCGTPTMIITSSGSTACKPSITPGIVDITSSSAAVGSAVSGVLGALLLLSGIINIVVISILIRKRKSESQPTTVTSQVYYSYPNVGNIEMTSCIAYEGVRKATAQLNEEPIYSIIQ